jgi:ribulose-bisphosphate carboxylase large chain
MKGARKSVSCDWNALNKSGKKKVAAPRKPEAATPRLHRHRKDFSWSGVRTERYKFKDDTWQSVIRRVLVGEKGENVKFHLRYFEIAPGGHTTLEQHRHEHVVVGIRGSGRCRANGRTYDIGFLDTLYIPPMATHQLINTSDEPFGFFCVVDAKRDRPKAVMDNIR